MDRYSLHAAVERLISSRGHDEDARLQIAGFGRTLRRASHLEVEASITEPGDAVAGQTPEHGSVQVRDETPLTRDFATGTPKERVGFYKIWRQQNRRQDWILISHFWKADQATESQTELAQQWVLALGKSGAPLWFGERGIRSLFSLRLPKASTLLVDREVYVELWGSSAGHEHKAGILVNVVVSD